MKKINIVVILLIIAAFCSACSNQSEQPVEPISSVVGKPSLGEAPSDENDPRVQAMLKSNSGIKGEIDPSKYEITLKDIYRDNFYLNLEKQSGSLSFYKGQWESLGIIYDVKAFYDSESKALSITAGYKDDAIMMYHLRIAAPNYFSGKFSWYYNANGYYAVQTMYMMVEKGEFPGMNSGF